MQTIHIRIQDQIHVIYVSRDLALLITHNKDGTYTNFKNIRQFWARVEREVRSAKPDLMPCQIKVLARQMVKSVSPPAAEPERLKWLAIMEQRDTETRAKTNQTKQSNLPL